MLELPLEGDDRLVSIRGGHHGGGGPRMEQLLGHNNAIVLKTTRTSEHSRGRSDFDLDAGVTYRDQHFKAFWRDRDGFTVYNGTNARDARATRVSLIPDSPMVLLYRRHETTSNLVPPRPASGTRPATLPITTMVALPNLTDKPKQQPAPEVVTGEIITLVTIIVDGSMIPGQPIISLHRARKPRPWTTSSACACTSHR